MNIGFIGTGEITKSSSTPIGVYTLTLKIEDAVSGGVAQTGSLSITKTQKIKIEGWINAKCDH